MPRPSGWLWLAYYLGNLKLDLRILPSSISMTINSISRLLFVLGGTAGFIFVPSLQGLSLLRLLALGQRVMKVERTSSGVRGR